MLSKLQREVMELFAETGHPQTPITMPDCVLSTIRLLNHGECRVCEIDDKANTWQVNEWLKKAILLFFKYSNCTLTPNAYDKIKLKFEQWEAADFETAKIRVVPGAIVRYGAFIGKEAVLMNCFVNIGAYVGQRTMVDSFATVGSCAQIGANCHLASGSVIGGVLEPVTAAPVVIEDNCLIGANAVVAEGVVVRNGATIAMGTRLGASTKIIDRETKAEFHKEVPEKAVVVPGAYQSNGLSIACAVIVGYKDRDYINENLR
ncbi:MAG: 2,3,4,5-tetrahydropyridine-2,6-dicarboxylate N-succinyltransferase [Holosporales bacterium]|nr:2,3,4,5-tetrahydropyridine-2,6-dicarboxylate N-succinyltransferase [Holosporales bacterium]